MAGAVGLRDVRYGYDGDNHVTARKRRPAEHALDAEGRVQSLFHLRSVEVHCLLALRARLRGSAGHLRADHRGQGLRQPRLAGHARGFPESSECVSCGACVQACPTATLTGKVDDRDRPAGTFGGDDLRLLRCRLLLQGGNARRGTGPHDAVQGRQGESRPFLRQGPLRLGLRQPPGPHSQSDDPRDHRRAVARGLLGRSLEFHRQQAEKPAERLRQELDRRDHLVALHQRGDLPGAEAGRAPFSATTTPTPAPASAIRRPATVSARLSAPRRARRISIPSSSPTW
jgi:ferredoxin